MFTIDETKEIIDKYNNGKSMTYIAAEFGVSITPIRRVITNENIPIRKGSYVRKYKIDEHYFDKIDTPNKAYILGFIYADGSNTSNYDKNHYCVAITLHKQDSDILEKIRDELRSDAPIKFRTYGNTEICNFNICNKYMILRLHELGVVPNKTLTLRFPEWLDRSLYSHFIRGYFDGDGCITRRTRGDHSQISCSITSTEDMCNSILNIILDMYEINAHVYNVGHKKCNKNIKTFMVSGNIQCKKFLDYIYQNSDLKLDRKYKRYIEWYYNN